MNDRVFRCMGQGLDLETMNVNSNCCSMLSSAPADGTSSSNQANKGLRCACGALQWVYKLLLA